jgi:hypothetical protein
MRGMVRFREMVAAYLAGQDDWLRFVAPGVYPGTGPQSRMHIDDTPPPFFSPDYHEHSPIEGMIFGKIGSEEVKWSGAGYVFPSVCHPLMPEEDVARFEVCYFFPYGSVGLEVSPGVTLGRMADMSASGHVTLSMTDGTRPFVMGGDTSIYSDGNAIVWVRYVVVIPVVMKYRQFDCHLPYSLPPVVVFDFKRIPASCPVMIPVIMAFGVMRRRHLHYVGALARAKKGAPVWPKAAQLSRSTLFSDPYYHGMTGFLLAFLLPQLSLVPFAKKLELLQLISRVSNDNFAVHGTMALEDLTRMWEETRGGEDINFTIAVFMSFYFIIRSMRTFKLTGIVWLPEDGPEYSMADLDTVSSTLSATIKYYEVKARVKRGFADGLTSYLAILR